MPVIHQSVLKLKWSKSSYSGGNATECVECAHITHGVLIRDSKAPDGPALPVGTDAWRCFVDGLKRGRPRELV